MKTKIKICGLTSQDDALYAASAGADALGVVNVKESKRFVDLKTAKYIFSDLPPFVSKVVVSSPKDIDYIKKIERTGADIIQLHELKDLGFLKEAGKNSSLGIIIQLPVEDESTVCLAQECSDYADALLLDTKTIGQLGGTGKTHDWNISREIVKSVKKPVILAGGLNPGNVSDAIRKVRPYAVDVASGVERSPGMKDRKKIDEFIMKVKENETA